MAHNKDKSFKVGIIGCGNIAHTQLKYIVKYVEKKSIALCDKNPLRMEYLSKEFGLTNKFIDVEILLQKFHPKVVHILTPPHTHKDIALICLENGANIFIEKPMCINTEEAKAIVIQAKEKNLQVCVDHMRLFDPLILKVKDLISSGVVGEIINIHTKETDPYYQIRKSEGLVQPWLESLPGEIIYDLIPHHLSLLYEFFGTFELNGVAYTYKDDKTLTNLSCNFTSPSGIATVFLSTESYPYENRVTFECTKGNIIADFRNLIIIVRKKYSIPGPVERIIDTFSVASQMIKGSFENILLFLKGKIDTYRGMELTIQNFYKSISQNKPSPIPLENAYNVVSTMEKIFEKIPKRNIVEDSKEIIQKADVLVTGGTGFIGKKLVERLSQEGYKVRVLTHRNIDKKNLGFNDNVQLIKGNISNYDDVEKACQGIKTVYHLAAATKGDWLYHLDTTVTGTQNIIDAALKSGVKHLVYVSTIGLLNASKYPQDGVIDENFPYEEHPEKCGYYSHAKLIAEKIAKTYINNSHKMVITIIRPGLVYGQGKDILASIPVFQFKNLAITFGSKKRFIPLVYVENLIDALIIANEKRESGIYNVIDSEKITIEKLIMKYKELTNKKFFTIYVPGSILKISFRLMERIIFVLLKKEIYLSYKIEKYTKNVIHSNKKIEDILGWKSRVNFKEALMKTLKNS